METYKDDYRNQTERMRQLRKECDDNVKRLQNELDTANATIQALQVRMIVNLHVLFVNKHSHNSTGRKVTTTHKSDPVVNFSEKGERSFSGKLWHPTLCVEHSGMGYVP